MCKIVLPICVKLLFTPLKTFIYEHAQGIIIIIIIRLIP